MVGRVNPIIDSSSNGKESILFFVSAQSFMDFFLQEHGENTTFCVIPISFVRTYQDELCVQKSTDNLQHAAVVLVSISRCLTVCNVIITTYYIFSHKVINHHYTFFVRKNDRHQLIRLPLCSQMLWRHISMKTNNNRLTLNWSMHKMMMERTHPKVPVPIRMIKMMSMNRKFLHQIFYN